jgi:hypothetical protein
VQPGSIERHHANGASRDSGAHASYPARQPFNIAVAIIQRLIAALVFPTTFASGQMEGIASMATSMVRHSRVYSSMTVRHLNCWPVAIVSKTKS